MEAEIFDFYHKKNLHVLLTDVMDKAIKANEENPSLFMAEYFLKEAGTDIQQHFSKKIVRDQEIIEAQKKKLDAVAAQHDAIKARRDELSQMLADRARGSDGEENIGNPGQGKDMAAFKELSMLPSEPPVLVDHT